MDRRIPFAAVVLTVAIATAMSTLPAASQAPKGPKTQVFIDVATHSMAGMPNLGGLGGFMMRRMGGDSGPKEYPQSRSIPPGTGRFLDIAMYNALKPGTEAQEMVPAGLGVGRSLPLLPPEPGRGDSNSAPGALQDIDVTIHQYWGCGAEVRPGQPKSFTVRVKRGEMQTSGGLARGVFVPDRDVNETPAWAVWPNRKNTKRVAEDASLVGAHQIVGDGVPESLSFELTETADFMPAIDLNTSGTPADAISVSWRPVARAQAYFVTAMGARSEREFVLWSSAEQAGAGGELLNYLPRGNIGKWVQQKVLLANGVSRCVIPKGIFAGGASGRGGDGGGMGGFGMLTMIAYGPETNIVWPPKPADLRQPWNPEWNVRVRSKSTASALLGMELGDMQDNGDRRPQPREQEQPSVKGLLRGIFGGG